MIRAVIFDFGGVLSEAGKRGSISRIFDEVYGVHFDALKIDDLGSRMWRGQITDEDFLAEIARRNPGMPLVAKEEFLKHTDIFHRSEPVYELAKELRAQGIKTGILSNVFGIGLKVIEDGGFYEGFDPLVISCREGMAKPDMEIYQLTVDRTGVKPHEMIYIDDQQVLLDPAGMLGIHMVLATSPEQIVSDVKSIIEAERGVQ